jgi:hypothetical protein
MSYAERVVHIDTSQVRVTEWRLGPGASTSPRCQNCDVVMIPLTGGRIRFKPADGESLVEITPGVSIPHGHSGKRIRKRAERRLAVFAV